jgi:hypothetical protein
MVRGHTSRNYYETNTVCEVSSVCTAWLRGDQVNGAVITSTHGTDVKDTLMT